MPNLDPPIRIGEALDQFLTGVTVATVRKQLVSPKALTEFDTTFAPDPHPAFVEEIKTRIGDLLARSPEAENRLKAEWIKADLPALSALPHQWTQAQRRQMALLIRSIEAAHGDPTAKVAKWWEEKRTWD